ncbi:MAG TPA: hypothetical protein VGW40_01235 [Allosphingosinicella sp.]|nr:hypothetical protein [Allosphingosinicella sp.]
MVNVRSLLDDHEASIEERIAVLRAELVPLERELFEVRLAKAALERGFPSREQPQLAFLKGARPSGPASHVDVWRQRIVSSAAIAPRSPYARLTIKELVRKALSEHFTHGATANQLLELFANAWGRTDVVRTSLSPQLSRLRQERVLFREGQVWRLRTTDNVNHSEKTAADQ